MPTNVYTQVTTNGDHIRIQVNSGVDDIVLVSLPRKVAEDLFHQLRQALS